MPPMEDAERDRVAARPLGVPLDSGFDYKPTNTVPEAQLDEQAIERIERGFKQIDAARLDAASKSRRYIIG